MEVADPVCEESALAALPTILVAPASLPAKSLEEFVALAKSKPGFLSYGSAGLGSIHHLTMAIFAERTGIELLHVPYRGGSAMVNGLLTGEIQVGWSGIPNVIELIASGKLRGFCVSVLQRSPSTPAMPTCDTRKQCFPTRTLWPICTRLSIFVPSPMTVSPSAARSIVVPAPISTSFSMRTMPICGIL